MSKGLKLSEILVTVLISVVFAIIYNLWWFVYNIVQVAGIHLEQLTYGVWFMAAVVCYLIIPKPGIALLAEIAAGAGERLLWENLIYLLSYMRYYRDWLVKLYLLFLNTNHVLLL